MRQSCLVMIIPFRCYTTNELVTRNRTLRDYIYKMDHKMKNLQFLNNATLKTIFDLTSIVSDTNIQKISEAWTVVAPSNLFARFSKIQYELILMTVASISGGALSWAEEVKYMLRYNVQSSHLHGAIGGLRGMSHKHPKRIESTPPSLMRQSPVSGICTHKRGRSQQASMRCIQPVEQLLPPFTCRAKKSHN